jgi:two-component system sensor histidine kinase KdpD
MQNFFRESTLVALRELALRQTAHEVEHRMVNEEGVQTGEGMHLTARRHDRILVHVTTHPETAMLIRRARRMSDFLDAECFAVTVQASGDLRTLPESELEAINRHLNFARNLHIETRVLEGEDTARTLIDFARRNQITQIFLARPTGNRWLPLLSRNLVQRVVSLAKDMQIVIVSERKPGLK